MLMSSFTQITSHNSRALKYPLGTRTKFFFSYAETTRRVVSKISFLPRHERSFNEAKGKRSASTLRLCEAQKIQFASFHRTATIDLRQWSRRAWRGLRLRLGGGLQGRLLLSDGSSLPQQQREALHTQAQVNMRQSRCAGWFGGEKLSTAPTEHQPNSIKIEITAFEWRTDGEEALEPVRRSEA
jgi:hypothetical protein